ncbi:endonuclease/exonuclease/phosphatase [Pedobacter yulinensis]|uniref:Endonuclease/exonuclease/phosphatase n=2 Tax=Pedobacter yulinensis TaxID=2126353 RepID=A0A2T3HMX5_9SPHI|nr:endonuclease/exonuclease/phosphatase [Pedobacter yulinensis]
MSRKLIFILAGIFFALYTRAQLPNDQSLRLRVGVYNVGHFNQGSLGGFQGLPTQARAEIMNWRRWIGKQSLDIFAFNEWNKHFDKDSVFIADQALLEPFYKNRYFGRQNRWIYNGIATNYKLTNIREKRWPGDYYAIIGDLKIGKKVITVMSSHLPWQKGQHLPGLDSLLAEMKKYEYLICMGDMNASDAEQLRFEKDGFNIANGGYMGWFTTAAGNARAAGVTGGLNMNIDNIVTTKNIKILNVSAPFTGLNDLDHLPVLADLIVTW